MVIPLHLLTYLIPLSGMAVGLLHCRRYAYGVLSALQPNITKLQNFENVIPLGYGCKPDWSDCQI